MKLQEKIELLQSSSSKAILNGGGHNGTPLLKYVFEVHEEVFGMPCKSCSSLLPGYIQKIQNINLNEEIMSAKERKYRMKSGSVIRVNGTNKYYSDLSITDEIAEKLLKVNPNRAALFAKIPEGALKRLAKEKSEEEKSEAEKEAEEKAEAEEAARKAAEEAKAKEEQEKKEAQEKAEEEKSDEDLNMTELREKYPHIKARSKEEFLRELAESEV